mmetsp:Transcript_10302/g.13443  ORF Transcript_10302/g.13443 Transcript_10302/m.13443 type:complete len:94 (+) Transcript_10302:87-368(+)
MRQYNTTNNNKEQQHANATTLEQKQDKILSSSFDCFGKLFYDEIVIHISRGGGGVCHNQNRHYHFLPAAAEDNDIPKRGCYHFPKSTHPLGSQ